MARKTNNKSSSKGNKRKASDASIDNNPPSKKNKNDEITNKQLDENTYSEDNSLPVCSKQPKNDTKQCCEWPVTTFLFQAEHGYINQHYNPLIDTEDSGKIKSLKHLLSLFEKNYMPIVTNKNSLINENVVVSQSNFFQKDKLYSTPLYFNLQGQHPLTVTMIGRQKIRLLAPETTKAAYLCTYDLDENKKPCTNSSNDDTSPNDINKWTLYPTKSSPVKKSNNVLFATENDRFHHKKGPAIQRRLFWVTINKKEEESPFIDTIDNFEDLTRNNRIEIYEKKLWTEVENLPTKIITDSKSTLLDLRQTGVEQAVLPICLEQTPENESNIICNSEKSVSIVDSMLNFQTQVNSAAKDASEKIEMNNSNQFLTADQIDELLTIKQQVPNNIVETICETRVSQPTLYHDDENGDENDDNNSKSSTTNQYQISLMQVSNENSDESENSKKMSELDRWLEIFDQL